MCIGLLFPLLALLLSMSSNLSLSRSKHWGIWHSQVEGGDSSSREGRQCRWAKGVAQRQWDHLLQTWQSQIAVLLVGKRGYYMLFYDRSSVSNLNDRDRLTE